MLTTSNTTLNQSDGKVWQQLEDCQTKLTNMQAKKNQMKVEVNPLCTRLKELQQQCDVKAAKLLDLSKDLGTTKSKNADLKQE